jgi:hypothetical protein
VLLLLEGTQRRQLNATLLQLRILLPLSLQVVGGSFRLVLLSTDQRLASGQVSPLLFGSSGGL